MPDREQEQHCPKLGLVAREMDCWALLNAHLILLMNNLPHHRSLPTAVLAHGNEGCTHSRIYRTLLRSRRWSKVSQRGEGSNSVNHKGLCTFTQFDTIRDDMTATPDKDEAPFAQ